MNKNERRICWYSSVLIVLMISTPKLLALRQNGIIAHYWHFNLVELLFQMLINFLFCMVIFFYNLNPSSPFTKHGSGKKYIYYLVNLLLFFGFTIIGGIIQKRFFVIERVPEFFWAGYFSRIFLSILLVGIIIRIMMLNRDSKEKEVENEKLKNAFVAAELELLKEQMNPHFLFNSLSSLSGVIRENPELAQKYVRELSNVFRYSLEQSKANLVTLGQELEMLNSFAQLITMRLEHAFKLHIRVDEQFLNYKLPHLSLQPLLENAVKHNAATLTRPLNVDVAIQHNKITVTNSLWETPVPEASTGLGLINLNERFKIMTGNEIEIFKTMDVFTVKLPLTA